MTGFFKGLLRRWLPTSGNVVPAQDNRSQKGRADVVVPDARGFERPVIADSSSASIKQLYDEDLYERARTQWQFGDWGSLAAVTYESLQQHPDRAKLALMVAAGHLQSRNANAARQFIRLARDWGCSKKLIAQILVAGVHNSLGRAAALGGQMPRALKHFNQSVATGTPASDIRLIGQARVTEQLAQLGLLEKGTGKESGKRVTLQELENANADGGKPNRAIRRKGTLRVIHHLACTGGTLFTKCVAAQPRVMVLNEVDPYSDVVRSQDGKSAFAPSDVLALIKSSEALSDDKTIGEIFLNDLKLLLGKLSGERKSLVLRIHSQGAYVKGGAVRATARINSLLETRFDVKSVVTVRDPIDSFLSLKANDWLFYTPPTFDEYCRRYLAFLQDNAGTPWFKYEDFIARPRHIMQELCAALDLEYSPDFIERFHNYRFSGDSGRTGSVIERRTRRAYDAQFVDDAGNSKSYHALADLLQYEILTGSVQ